jgi:hypothetical protein
MDAEYPVGLLDMYVSQCGSAGTVQMLYILCAMSVFVGLLAACKIRPAPTGAHQKIG